MDPIGSWKLEKESAYLYRVISKFEKGRVHKQLFAKLSEEAEKQAALWEAKFAPNLSPIHFSPSARARLIGILVRFSGPRAMRGILSAMKVRGMSVYQNPLEIGSRHQSMGAGNWLRAAVFGANDGLVSNASLILGVSGAALNTNVILLSGAAGMLAGAFSMACGEYISVKSQREFFEKQMAAEKEELDSYPEEEAAELALIFEARGLSKEEAQRNAKTLIADPEKALETLAREELGINPSDLGSPMVAACSSFAAFLTGAALPLVPFFFRSLESPVFLSMFGCAFGLFGMGVTISLFTGRAAWWGGIRMVLLGAFAGSCTYFMGWLLGVHLS